MVTSQAFRLSAFFYAFSPTHTFEYSLWFSFVGECVPVPFGNVEVHSSVVFLFHNSSCDTVRFEPWL